MQKIVINRCYGGFGLSRAGLMRYAELKGIKLYEFKDGFMTHYATQPVDNEDDLNKHYFSDHSIERDDLCLVQVVEELGKDASGMHGDIHVVSIPDDVEWQIKEYDGLEWIAEKHRTWR